jgi:(p)ppGpp synthase/HD superfamily hydrolase
MAARLTETFLHWKTAQNDADWIIRAYWLAMEKRRVALTEQHPAMLHPGRVILILFHDAGVRATDVLCASALLDSHQPWLAPEPESVRDEMGAAVARLVEAVPAPGRSGEELLEQLLVAEPDVQLIALAERLDFARHLHLITNENWATQHMLIRDVYLPVALRANVLLGRRFAYWVDAFGSRRLQL